MPRWRLRRTLGRVMAEILDGVMQNPAEAASERALSEVYACIEGARNFRLEAGAGAGKTYSLVKALQFLIERNSLSLRRRSQRVACITFTNVAKNEIEARTDRSPLIYCDTTHAFCWSLISGFQKQLRDFVRELPAWAELIESAGRIDECAISYTLGYRGIKEGQVTLHHDDVLALTIRMMGFLKFRQLVADQYPFILIDEYQDTDAGLVEAIENNFLGEEGSPTFGFFGDHWQKIYGNGCGHIEHPSLTVIGKEANFRSVITIVDCLNRMRPELPQSVVNPEDIGSVHIFHTNAWGGQRQTGQHWGGDLPNELAHATLNRVIELLMAEGWDFSPSKTKILMLTHRGLAGEQGYASLPQVFRYNDSYTKKEHPHIAFFVDVLEPACDAFTDKKYGAMFEALGGAVPAIRSKADKELWVAAMDQLVALKTDGTVGQVIDLLRHTHRPRLPDNVERREHELEIFVKQAGEEMPRSLQELESLRGVPYKEITALRRYLVGHSPFETKHGVKGAEFENVLVVVGRGWNQYNFREMLELARGAIPPGRRSAFERNRNLFYVACSRPKRNLAILFTQELTEAALATLQEWFGEETISALDF